MIHKTDQGYASAPYVEKWVCPKCNYVLDNNGKVFNQNNQDCPKCGAKMRPTITSPIKPAAIVVMAKEERAELRNWINENIELDEEDRFTDVGQLTGEWKRAAGTAGRAVSSVKKVPAAIRRVRVKRLERKKSGIETKQTRAAYRLKRRESKHTYKSKMSGLKAKKAGMKYRAITDEAYDNDTQMAMPYKFHKKQLKRKYKLSKLQRKLDYLQSRD